MTMLDMVFETVAPLDKNSASLVKEAFSLSQVILLLDQHQLQSLQLHLKLQELVVKVCVPHAFYIIIKKIWNTK